jgi:predicted RNA-binding Zn-ribbon protein involved in translation (DUF1610 family)
MSEAKNHPFHEVCRTADERIKEGHTVFQKFTCAQCGERQTMPDANKFYTLGICEECGHTTDIVRDGCNYMLITGC